MIRSHVTFGGLGAALFCSLVIACSGSSSGKDDDDNNGGGTKVTGASVGDFCGAICDKQKTCDNKADTQTCSNKCQNANAVALPKYRAELADSVQACVTGKDCKTVLAGSATSACMEEALAGLSPSQAGKDFCTSGGAKATKCSQELDKAECLGMVKRYSDTTLNLAAACFDKACADVNDCLGAALGLTGGSSGSTNGGTGSTDDGATTGGTSRGTTGGMTTGGTTSGTSSGTTGSGPSCGANLFGDTACYSCIESACCGENVICAGDAECSGLIQCLMSCGSDSTCGNQCAQIYPNGMSRAQTLGNCVSGSCSSACQ